MRVFQQVLVFRIILQRTWFKLTLFDYSQWTLGEINSIFLFVYYIEGLISAKKKHSLFGLQSYVSECHTGQQYDIEIVPLH